MSRNTPWIVFGALVGAALATWLLRCLLAAPGQEIKLCKRWLTEQ